MSATSTTADPPPRVYRAPSTSDRQASALLAVCDVLVIRALERMGQWVVRGGGRERYRTLDGRPWFIAHTLWPPSEEQVERAIAHAWDVVPALLDNHGCCGVTSRQVTEMLDSYVRDLAITGTGHSIAELQYRFSRDLDLTVILAIRRATP